MRLHIGSYNHTCSPGFVWVMLSWVGFVRFDVALEQSAKAVVVVKANEQTRFVNRCISKGERAQVKEYIYTYVQKGYQTNHYHNLGTSISHFSFAKYCHPTSY